jgi:hypothetical protein
MRTGFVLAAVTAVVMLASNSFAQECLRPEWTHCEEFPNGGRLTGVAIDKSKLDIAVPPGSRICVVNHEEIGGDSFAHFERNGVRWPNPDWLANVDNFCFFKN